MTRGRRKDLTIPPSRALLQQRDYRARKAQYVADLEDRIRRTEEENVKLKKELDALRNTRATVPGNVGPSPEVVTASSELMHQLTAAASCLARFQQLTFSEQHKAQASAQAHALSQAQLQTQNLQPHSPSSSNELPPIRAPPMNETHVQLPPATSFAGPPSHAASRQPTPPRAALHPSRHSQPLEFHHHNPLASPPPLHVPNTQRREYLHPSQMDTARPTPVPSSSSASSSTSVSTSPTSSRQTLSRARADSYTGYNEIDTACWGYFDSRDLSQDDEDDEEDELYEEETHTTRTVMHVHHRAGRSPVRANGDRGDHGGRSSSRMIQRTSDMRSTASSSGPEDTPMRMREDSPMRTR